MACAAAAVADSSSAATQCAGAVAACWVLKDDGMCRGRWVPGDVQLWGV